MHYDKPFFSTYFKTTLFSSYLLGFAAYAPWREECSREINRYFTRKRSTHGDYRQVAENDHDNEDSAEDETLAHCPEDDADRILARSLSSPSFVPANIPESGKSSGTEESDAPEGSLRAPSRNRRVRFKTLAEVVEMNPSEAMAANLARLSYNASLRAQAALRRAAQRLSISAVAQLALVFCVPWFLGNYSYQMALSKTEAAIVNVLSSTSSLLTLILSALFPSDKGDKLTLSKLCGVAFSICGVVLVSYSDIAIEGKGVSIPKGALWAMSGAFFYSVYIVLLRRKVHHEENMDVPMFFGFVGLFNTVLMWPGILVSQWAGGETFEFPNSQQLEALLINGLIGTVISELLWLLGCFYTSSLIATLAVGLTIPLTIIADILWRGQTFEPIFLVGVVPMFVSFFVITLLTHYPDWDPALDGLRYVCRLVMRKPPIVAMEVSEQEVLLEQHEDNASTETS